MNHLDSIIHTVSQDLHYSCIIDNFSIKVKMVELTARVRVFSEQWLTTPGDLQEGAGGQRSTVL